MAVQPNYELYRNSSIGTALTDTLDDLISDNLIEPQLAMRIIANFDKAFTEIISEKVKSRLSFKGHLATYRFCDDVWTFLIKDVNFKLDNQAPLKADKVKIVSCTNKKADTPTRAMSLPNTAAAIVEAQNVGDPMKIFHTKQDDRTVKRTWEYRYPHITGTDFDQDRKHSMDTELAQERKYSFAKDESVEAKPKVKLLKVKAESD